MTEEVNNKDPQPEQAHDLPPVGDLPTINPEAIKDMVDAGRIDLKMGGHEITFKIPDFEEFLIVEENLPILDTSESKDDLEIAKDFANAGFDVQKRFFDRCNKMLTLCAVSPRLVDGENAPTDEVEGEVWVRWFRSNDRASAFACLMMLSSYSQESALVLRPFSESPSSKPWMRLQPATDASPAKSSPLVDNSNSVESSN
jgi:hypothetical protein